ncbi:hypothetical protein Cgig2_001460 [Carnegiea gigantea]|uniref:Secreted protein n=1 Tax=Carnegiea gigantea TaxID=171969 RepID=A0A9Q1QPX2_9CARY|nr:hypothetical protein Cgig2_001460 [Carnegiea gigantea]
MSLMASLTSLTASLSVSSLVTLLASPSSASASASTVISDDAFPLFIEYSGHIYSNASLRIPSRRNRSDLAGLTSESPTASRNGASRVLRLTSFPITGSSNALSMEVVLFAGWESLLGSLETSNWMFLLNPSQDAASGSTVAPPPNLDFVLLDDLTLLSLVSLIDLDLDNDLSRNPFCFVFTLAMPS